MTNGQSKSSKKEKERRMCMFYTLLCFIMMEMLTREIKGIAIFTDKINLISPIQLRSNLRKVLRTNKFKLYSTFTAKNLTHICPLSDIHQISAKNGKKLLAPKDS